MAIEMLGKFTPIGMRTKVEDATGLIINTCGQNDTAEKGTPTNWVWSNPTNRAVAHPYEDVVAVSVECLWQGTKMKAGMDAPDALTLAGDWRRGKGRKPIGAYAGRNTDGSLKPLLTTPGAARRAIYIPAFKRLIAHWMADAEVAKWVQQARDHKGSVYLRDFDTGRGIDRNGPMSHAFVLATFLNTGKWPGE